MYKRQGTRLRIGDHSDAPFAGSAFLRNDVEVEVLTSSGDFCKVRAVGPGDEEPVEGWVRTRYVSKHAKGADSAMAALRDSYNDIAIARRASTAYMANLASLSNVGESSANLPVTPTPAPMPPALTTAKSSVNLLSEVALAPEAAPAGALPAAEATTTAPTSPADAQAAVVQPKAGVSQANSEAYELAAKSAALDLLASTIAAELKSALARANLRTMELFRELSLIHI